MRSDWLERFSINNKTQVRNAISSETKIIIIPIDRVLKTKFAAKVVFITRPRMGTGNNSLGRNGLMKRGLENISISPWKGRVGSTGNQDECFVSAAYRRWDGNTPMNMGPRDSASAPGVSEGADPTNKRAIFIRIVNVETELWSSVAFKGHVLWTRFRNVNGWTPTSRNTLHFEIYI